MEVLYTTDLSREGNDCYINEAVSLVKQFGIYAVIKSLKVSGWADREEITVLISTGDYEEARHTYKNNGGTF